MIALTLGSPAAMDRVPQCGGVTSRKEGDFARPGGGAEPPRITDGFSGDVRDRRALLRRGGKNTSSERI